MLLRSSNSTGGGSSKGETLLHCAAKKGDSAMVQMLLAEGVPQGATDGKGRTAYQLAKKCV